MSNDHADDDLIGDHIRSGSIPIRFDLDVADLASPTPPAPIHTRVRRIAYLVQLVPQLNDTFQEFTSGSSSRLWLQCDQLGPVPWQYPAGALYDLLRRPARPRPWPLHVRLTAAAPFPSAVVAAFTTGANSTRAHFLNAVKQASVLMFGTADPVRRLSLEQIQALFETLSTRSSLSAGTTATGEGRLSRTDRLLLLFQVDSPNQRHRRRCLPVRFLTFISNKNGDDRGGGGGGGGVRMRQRPLDAAESWTVGGAFCWTTGEPSADGVEFVAQGIVLPADADLHTLCALIPFHDMFLYVSYRIGDDRWCSEGSRSTSQNVQSLSETN